MGTTLALPFLESMVPAFTALAQIAARGRRCGSAPSTCRTARHADRTDWMPTAQDGTLEITPILKPLEPFRDQMTVVGNLSRAGGKTVTDHAVSSAGWLSGVVAKQTEAEDISLGVTIDQVLARQIGQDTPFPSLEFATEDFSGYVGGCVPGYSCTYMNTISWAGETSPLPMEINPRVAFERMFGRAGDADAAAGADAREPQHPRFDGATKRGSCSARSARRTARASTSISTTCARSSGASSGPKRATPPT